jgi:hypothetical protein
MAGDEDIDVVRRAPEQPQRGEVVLDRVRAMFIQAVPSVSRRVSSHARVASEPSNTVPYMAAAVTRLRSVWS